MNKNENSKYRYMIFDNEMWKNATFVKFEEYKNSGKLCRAKLKVCNEPCDWLFFNNDNNQTKTWYT